MTDTAMKLSTYSDLVRESGHSIHIVRAATKNLAPAWSTGSGRGRTVLYHSAEALFCITKYTDSRKAAKLKPKTRTSANTKAVTAAFETGQAKVYTELRELRNTVGLLQVSLEALNSRAAAAKLYSDDYRRCESLASAVKEGADDSSLAYQVRQLLNSRK